MISTISCLVALSDLLAASFSSFTSASDTALTQITLNSLSKQLKLLFGHFYINKIHNCFVFDLGDLFSGKFDVNFLSFFLIWSLHAPAGDK